MRRFLPACAFSFAVSAVACGGTNSPLFDDEDGTGGAASTGASQPSSSGTGDTTATSTSTGGDTTSSVSSGDATNSSSSSSGEGGGGAGGGSGGSAVCGDAVIGDPVPAVVVLTLDASGSMAGGDGFPDKWTPTTSAIASVVDDAPGDLQFGLVPFPAGDFDVDAQLTCGDLGSPECQEIFADGGCEDVREEPAVEIAPLDESGPAIVDWMQARTPDGGTPTYWALRRSYEIARAASGDGDRFVVLFTDGEPNTHAAASGPIPETNIECRDLADIIDEAQDAAAADPPVRTYVVGAPGSEGAGQFLSELAVAGGTAPAGCSTVAGQCHVQIGAADYEDDLALALADIAGKAAGCRFVVPLDAGVDVDLIEVVLETGRDDIDVARDPDHTEGWDLVVEDPTTIELYGSACELYREEASNVVRVQVLCEE